MWSKLRVELNNIKSMNIPQEADYVEVFVYPYPTGYSLQTKMANCYPLEEDRGEEMYISAGGQLMQMKVSDFITENNREAQAFVAATSDTPAIYLRFHQSSAPGIPRKDISCLKLTDLPLAENNKEYYVHGEIPSDPNNEYDFKISKTEFTGEKVDVPFSGIQ